MNPGVLWKILVGLPEKIAPCYFIEAAQDCAEPPARRCSQRRLVRDPAVCALRRRRGGVRTQRMPVAGRVHIARGRLWLNVLLRTVVNVSRTGQVRIKGLMRISSTAKDSSVAAAWGNQQYGVSKSKKRRKRRGIIV